MSSVDTRLQELGIELPEAPAAVGSYVPVIQFRNMVVTSGQLPMVVGELAFKGKIGSDLTAEDGAEAAKVATVNCLAQIKAVLGDLSRVQQIVRVEGFVNSADGFTAQPAVMNGASNLLSEIFGELGRHTRIAVGTNELPLDAAVEVVVWATVTESGNH